MRVLHSQAFFPSFFFAFFKSGFRRISASMDGNYLFLGFDKVVFLINKGVHGSPPVFKLRVTRVPDPVQETVAR